MKTKKQKLKNYEVSITSFVNVLVIEAENEEKALEYAVDKVNFGDTQIYESEVRRIVPNDELDSCRRHADVIAENE